MKNFCLIHLESKEDFRRNNDGILLIDEREQVLLDRKSYAEINEMSILRSYTPLKKTINNTPYAQVDKTFYEEPAAKHGEDINGYLLPVIDKGYYITDTSFIRNTSHSSVKIIKRDLLPKDFFKIWNLI